MTWSAALSVLVLVASVAGLTVPAVYGQESPNWALQAKGQDVGNILAVVVLMAAAARYRRGSHRAGLVWVGSLLYLIYAFIVYAVAVHLNALFLVYVAVLGVSAWGVLFHVGPMRRVQEQQPRGGRRVSAAAWVLIATGLLFAALWLSELVPATLTGTVPVSLAEAGLVVNPIHAIDLSIVLPGFLISGIASLRGRAHGLFWLAPWLVFSTLMGASIIAAMLLMMSAAFDGTTPATVMVATVVAASLLGVRACLTAPTAPVRDPANTP